jgi:hypothetical protein
MNSIGAKPAKPSSEYGRILENRIRRMVSGHKLGRQPTPIVLDGKSVARYLAASIRSAYFAFHADMATSKASRSSTSGSVAVWLTPPT